jgi:hypothetical protein
MARFNARLVQAIESWFNLRLCAAASLLVALPASLYEKLQIERATHQNRGLSARNPVVYESLI